MDENKYRHELKFIISPSYAEVLKHRLSFIMDVDENSVNSDNTYFIRSLYFDNYKSEAYYEKIDGVEKRKKYRIRIYNLDDKFIRLERKDKDRDLTHKEQTKITKDIYQNIIDNNLDNIDISNDKLLEEFITNIKTKNLKPTVVVDYRRLAYTYPVEDTRITFDEHIKSGRFNYDLFKDYMTYDVLESNESVLEVKFNNVIPSHIAQVIMTIPTVRQAVSKFALCREKKEL